jgi:hypothetical protein
MRKVWKYSGDVNIRQGGYFFNTEGLKYNYVDAVRVTACADAGGPDNLFWVETLVINMPEDEAGLKEVISCCGWIPDDLPKRGAVRTAMIVDACIAYGKYDPAIYNASIMVRIGRKEEARSEWDDSQEADVILRANASLRNYVRNEVVPRV